MEQSSSVYVAGNSAGNQITIGRMGMKLILRRAGGSAKNGWVWDEDNLIFVNPTRLVSRANSGNETWEWDLPPGCYTYREIWYGKKKQETITVPG